MSNWQKVKIGDFLFERKGRYKPNDEQIVNLPRIEKIDFSGNFHIGNKDSKTDMILIKDGDLVISGINVAKGAMGIYSGENVTATIHYSSYTFDSNKINVEYFKRFLKSSEFIELLNEQVKGGIKTEIKPKHILPLEIQLPDINTQAQIVQHFENVEDDINHVAQEVLTQQSLVKQLKQTILQEAIEGKLTAKWRTKNPEFDISKDFYELNSKAIKKPFEIPETWTWIKLDDLVNQKRGITYGIVKMGKEPTSDGVYALRCSDVKFRVIEIDNARKVTKEVSNQYKRTILHGGEILLNIRGTLGGCGIADDSLKGFNIAREIGLIPLENSGFTEYVFNVLTSPYFNTQIQNNLRGIAYKGLNLNLLRNFPIPLPPIEEQKEIVATIEKLFALCDELESEINQNKTTVDNLMATVLKEAFKQ